MNTVKTVSLLLFHYNEAVEGFKGWMEGFKSARFIKILKMLVLLDVLLIFSKYRSQHIMRLHSEVSCDQVGSPWF